jgi:hypothetical protein
MKNVYGANESGKCSEVDIPTLFQLITPSYDILITALATIVDKLLVITVEGTGINPIIADMPVNAKIPFVIRVRYAWKQSMPGVRFDKYNELHTDLLKDLYLINGQDWRTDPLFNGSA